MESPLVEFLVILAIVLTIVTLVGHGIWLVLAWLFRAGAAATAPDVTRPCLYCNRPTPADHAFCIWCHRSLEDEAAQDLADVRTSQRVVARMRKAGLISSDQCGEWEGRLEAYRIQLLPVVLKTAPPPVPAAEPAAAAPVEPPPAPAVPALSEELVDAILLVEKPPAPTPVPIEPMPVAEPPEPPAPKPPAPTEPAPPRKSLPDMLREFMEPHNIRWGELVGGLLFIIGAAALVVTQWETLERFRYFRFLAFAGTSASVFGVGLYAQYRWRLEATSRVLLTLATLLVPLNFLAMAGLAKDDPPLVSAAIDTASLFVFGALVTFGARILVPGGLCWQTGSVMGLSAVVLAAARWFSPASPGWALTVAGCLSAGIFAVGTGGYLFTAGQGRRVSPTRAMGIFSLTGAAGFALLVVLGLLVYRGIQPGTLSVVLDHLSIPLVLAAVPPLVAGLTVSRRMADRVSLEPYRASGNWMALVAGLVMLAALGLAWPWPPLMTAVGLFAALTLAIAALVFELPALHAGAIAAAAIAYLMGFYWAIGATAGVERADMTHQLLRLLVSARTGTALVGLVIAMAAMAYGLSRAGRLAHSLAYAIGSGVLALASLVSVSAAQPMDPWRAAIVYAIYALACLAACVHFCRPGLTYAGLGLLLAAVGWTLWGRIGAIDIQWAAAYAVAALAMSLVAALLRAASKPPFEASPRWWSPTSPIEAFRTPLAQLADFVAAGALVLGAAMAWLDQARIDHNPMPIVAAVALAIHWFLTAWLDRQAGRTVVASLVVLACLVHSLVFNYEGRAEHPWQVALLAHAALAIAASGALAWGGSLARRPIRHRLRQLVINPLSDTGIVSSLVAAALLVPLVDRSALMSQFLLALALMWLALAVLRISPVWMALHQIALAAAVGFGAYAWYGQLRADAWAAVHLNVPQTIGTALALLALAWVALRIAARHSTLARHLLQPGWPMPDLLLKYALVAVQLGYLVGYMGVPGYFVPGAWIVWGVLVAAITLSLWERFGAGELAAAVLLVVSFACLVAGPIAADGPRAVVLQWALAGCCLALAAASWARRPLCNALIAAKARIVVGPLGPMLVHALSLVLMALPAIALSLTYAGLYHVFALLPNDPAIVRALAHLSPMALQLVPLGLLLAALLGHAVRENSARYLFLTGLVVDWTVVLGQVAYYRGIQYSDTQVLGLVQWPTIAAALWGLAWLAASRRFGLWREGSSPWAGTLFQLQAGLSYAGNVPLWLLGVTSLVLAGSHASTTAAAIGSPVGWAAFLLAVAAGVARGVSDGRWLSPHFCGTVGMAFVGLLACTIQGCWPDAEWGCRTLSLGWAGYAWLIAAGVWWTATAATLPGAKGAPRNLIRAAAVWVRLACLASVLLALKTALKHDEQLWASAAIAVASAAGATMALWRRREHWAFAAALGANLSASIAVWHYHYTLDFSQWTILLVQANALASALVALVWIAASRRLYAKEGLSPETGECLAAQVALPIVANLLLAGHFLLGMATAPLQCRIEALQLSMPIGWLAMIATAASTAWYLYRVAPARLFHVLASLAFGLSVLTAATSFRTEGLGDFTPVYALLIVLASAGLLLACAGGLGRDLRVPLKIADRPALFPTPEVCTWVTLFGAAAVGFALRWCLPDPGRPWIPAWSIVCVAVSLALIALWQQRPGYVWAAGLLANLAGNVIWIVFGPWTVAGWVDLNAACLAAAAFAWLVAEKATGRVPALVLADDRWTFAHVALRVAVAALSLMVVTSLATQIAQPDDALLLAGFRLSEPIHPTALALAAIAVLTSLWDRRARFALAGLYALGLAAIGWALAALALPWTTLCVYATPALAAFALVAALVACATPTLAALARALRIPSAGDRWSGAWFSPAQALLTVVATSLALWLAVDFRFGVVAPAWLHGLPVRMAGPLAIALLTLAAWAMAAAVRFGRRSFLPADEDRQGWQELTLLGVALVPACLAWACLRPEMGDPWLLRTVVVVADLALWVFFFGLSGTVWKRMLRSSHPERSEGSQNPRTGQVLPSDQTAPRLLAAASDWPPVAQRVSAWLLLACAPAIAILLGMELHHYTPERTMPELAIAAAVAGLSLLAVACLGFALNGRDPLRLGERGRSDCYVYAAEALVTLVGIHLRLTWPEVFRLGIIERYGLFLAMGLAFGLAGLAELFDRRRMKVLAEPLERTALVLPLLPMIAFWLMGPHPAAVWFLIAAFYGLMSILRRSFWLGVLAVAAANVGLWVVWHRMEIGILAHPQLWLIPPALAALIAEYVSRGRLREEQAAAVRYVSLGVIYLSSSADMFIAGLGNSVVLPLVLLSLSVLGILLGMALRVKSFLYLGVTFLLVVVASLLKYVTIDLHQTWVIWLSVAALGAALLALFGVFEKRRNDVLAAMKRFRTWDR